MPIRSFTVRSDQNGAVETVLRLLAHRFAPCVALLLSASDDDLVVEDSSSAAALGRKLVPPAGLLAGTGALIDVSEGRLSLGWTELCGYRPGFIAAARVPGHALHLVVAGTGERPTGEELADVAAAIDPILGGVAVTSREQGASLKIAALIDNLLNPIVFVDSRTIEVALNDRARRLLELGDRQATEIEVAAAFARLIGDAHYNFERRLSTDPGADMTFEIERTGRCFEVESRWIDEERLTGRLWVFRDVTEARQIAKFKDELVSTVSHELRTPLTSIVGALGLLRNGKAGALPEAAAALVHIAYRNGERLSRLVNDLLDLDKVESAKLELHTRIVDVTALLREAAEQNEPYATRYSVQIKLDLADEVRALMDPDRILQVVSNLVSNAAKFSPPGGTVSLRLIERDDSLRISVSDTGAGISPEFRQRIFTRFAQEGSIAGKGGTGLGLAISKGIVEQHGGVIDLESVPSEGTTFHVDLPKNLAAPSPAEPTAAKAMDGVGTLTTSR